MVDIRILGLTVNEFNKTHPENALAPILVMLSGMDTDVIPVLRNKLAPMLVVVLGIITPSPRNAFAPMNVTDTGMTVSINEVPWKAPEPMLVTDAGMSMVVSPIQL